MLHQPKYLNIETYVFRNSVYLVFLPLENAKKGQTDQSMLRVSLLCFLETPVLRFALLPYYRRIGYKNVIKSFEMTSNSKDRTEKQKQKVQKHEKSKHRKAKT